MEVAPFFVDFHHFLSIFTIFYRFSRFTHFCRDLHFVAIYALFPQFFFGQNSLLRNITRFLHVCQNHHHDHPHHLHQHHHRHPDQHRDQGGRRGQQSCQPKSKSQQRGGAQGGIHKNVVSSDNVFAHLDLGGNNIKFLLKDDVSGLRVFSLRQILTQVR